jgi:hypothetical protein
MCSRNDEKLKTKSILFLHFSTLKNLQMKNNYVFVAAQCFSLHIVYGIYDLRFFKFDSPETCEGGALE